MVLESILGSIVGAISRSAPEIMRFFDKKNERKHELQMQDLQLQFLREQGAQKIGLADMETQSAQITAAIEAVRAASVEQATSGVKWVDGLSATVRPVVTYLVVAMWMMVKAAAYVQLSGQGLSWSEAALTLWGAEDAGLLSGITTFWFMSRVFQRIKI